MDPNSLSAQPNISKSSKWPIIVTALIVLVAVSAGAFFVWSGGVFRKKQGGSGQQSIVQVQNKQYKNEKYNLSFSYPAAYEVVESIGENILGSKESTTLTFTSETGIPGSGAQLTIAGFDWSGDLDSFVSEKIGADSQIKPQECPKKGDCRALVGSAAAKFPLQFVFKSANGITGIQLKDAQGVLLGTGIGEPLRTALGTLSR